MSQPDRETSISSKSRTGRALPRELDLSGNLLDRLPAESRLIMRRLAEAFASNREQLYLVGGSVRDLLLGREVHDLDLTTSAEPTVTKALGQAAGADSVYTIGEEFGTIGFVFSGTTVEITTYREELYLERDRHPQVRLGVELDGDLSRRDFTINAIAVEAGSGQIHDPFNGSRDLALGIIRAVGDPASRLREDPLRTLRAVRFAAQLGFAIEPLTLAAMAGMAPELAWISQERIATELNKLLVAPRAARGLALTHEAGMLPDCLPELLSIAEDPGEGRHKDIWAHTLLVVEQSPPRLAVRWAALLHDAAKPATRSVDETGEVHFFGHERLGANLARRALRRLKQERALIERVAGLVDLHLRPAGYDETWTDSAVRRLMVEAGDLLDDLLDLVAADVTSARADRRQAATQRMQGLRDHIVRLEAEYALDQLQSPLDGNELMEIFARPPGRWIGDVKSHLRELVIDGELRPDDKETALVEARRFLSEHLGQEG